MRTDSPFAFENQSRDQRIARLRRAISEGLTPCQQRAVIGYYIEGKRMTELAAEAGVCPSTICRTLHRGEAKLRYLLRF